MTGWVVSELKPRVRSSPAPPPAPEIVGRLTAKQLRDPVLVTSRLCRLTEVGGEHNYVIVEVGRCRYVQFLSSCGSAVMYAEASSGQYCKRDCTCSPTLAERARLRDLGWRPPTRRKFLNFYRFCPFFSERDGYTIAEMLVATLDVFGWRGQPLLMKEYLDW